MNPIFRIRSLVIASLFLFAGLALAGAENNYSAYKKAVPNQTVAAEGAGHSCHATSAKSKAEEEARSKAVANAVAKCKATSADCKKQCTSHDAIDGRKSNQLEEMEQTKDTWYKEGDDCGWDAKVTVQGFCGCICDYAGDTK